MELSRTSCERESTDLDRERRPWKPVIWTLIHDGQKLLVKDLRYSKTLYRYTVGRFLLGREFRIYKKLAGVVGVPRCFGRFDRDSVVLEFIEAESIRKVEELLDAAFFDAVEESIAALHSRGVVHMDLRHRSNVMRTVAGDPILIDFESSLSVGTNWFSQKVLLRWFAWVDRFALTKLRVRYCPETVSDDERRRYDRQSRLRRFWPFGRIWPPSRIWSRRRKNSDTAA